MTTKPRFNPLLDDKKPILMTASLPNSPFGGKPMMEATCGSSLIPVYVDAENRVVVPKKRQG